jgi:hypothetical protein
MDQSIKEKRLVHNADHHVHRYVSLEVIRLLHANRDMGGHVHPSAGLEVFRLGHATQIEADHVRRSASLVVARK